jgi:hypothetical protein
MQHLEGSGTPVLYIGRTVLKVKQLTALEQQNSHLFFVRHLYHTDNCYLFRSTRDRHQGTHKQYCVKLN